MENAIQKNQYKGFWKILIKNSWLLERAVQGNSTTEIFI